jgi:hypothetical protein
MTDLNQFTKLLGFKVCDVVTGFEGVVSNVAFDLQGCVQGLVTPEMGKEEKPKDSVWFDLKRLKLLSKKPVMQQPIFEVIPGGSALPLPASPPRK